MQQDEKLQLQSSLLLRFVQALKSYRVFAHGPRSCQATTHAPTKVNRPISALQMVMGNRTAENAVFLLGLTISVLQSKIRLVHTLRRKLRTG